MNNKGFTLVELIGIVVILSLMFLVTYPAILSLSKNEDDKQYDLMVKDLCLAGESYIYATGVQITINTTIEITISDLISYGNIDPNFKDVKTNSTIDSTKKIKYYVRADKTLECKY